MAAVVSELRSALARLAGDPAADLATVPALDEAPVTGDQVLLERLVDNLLGSAQRYNVAGGAVEISTTARDGTSVLRVINTGAVVPAELVERLFVPFNRLDDGTRHDGFGLGLTLVSSIATVHGGTVDAAAVPAGGLDIVVRLPGGEPVHWRLLQLEHGRSPAR
jgi:signal transduction histidine kinase